MSREYCIREKYDGYVIFVPPISGGGLFMERPERLERGVTSWLLK
jgi:hypothetical protein